MSARFTAEWDGQRMDYSSPSLLQFWGLLDGVHKPRGISSLFDPDAPIAIVDVGACIGAWTLSMAWRHPHASLWALEPCSVTFPHLARNVKGFNVQALQLAADEQKGSVTLQLPTEAEYSNRESQWWRIRGNYGTMTAYGTSGNGAEQVLTERLDDLCERADCLKLDVEGMELRVLRGAERILRECKPVIQMELSRHNQKRAGQTVEDLIDFLSLRGYTMVAIQKPNDGIFVPKEHVREAIEKLGRGYDLGFNSGPRG